MEAETYIGSPCKRAGHTLRYVSNKACAECGREDGKQWCADNLERAVRNARRWDAENPEKALAIHRKASLKWDAANKEWRAGYGLQYRQDNPEYERQRHREYKQTNPEKGAASTRRHTAAKMNRTPPWADNDWISHAYFVAADMTAKMGEKYEVDHIFPLQGRLVSGLHVYENLQILSAAENRSKGNKFIPITIE